MLNPEFIVANDIPDAWFQALWRIVQKGKKFKIDDGSYAGQKRIELDYVTLQIKYPGTFPRLPKINPNFGIPEPASEEYLESYINYLLTDIVKEGEQYTYGQYLVPQINEIIWKYKNHGHRTNQCLATIGDAESIYLSDPPCLRLLDTRIQENKLHFFVYFRSWDCWGGLPVNLAGLEYVKEYMALEIGIDTGETIACSKGLHIYDHIEIIVKTYMGGTDGTKAN